MITEWQHFVRSLQMQDAKADTKRALMAKLNAKTKGRQQNQEIIN